MTSPPDTVPAPTGSDHGSSGDPWDRFGWVMSAIWLVFLGFPVAAAVTSDQPVALRVLAVALVLGFAAVYLHGFIRLTGSTGRGTVGLVPPRGEPSH